MSFGTDIGNSHIRAQKRVSNYLIKISNGKVLYGPFKGLILPSQRWWGTATVSTMILGMYEREIVEEISDVSEQFSYFVDIGAADGFYAVGVLVANKFHHSFAFEISEKGRKSIRANAQINGVDSLISIYGKAEIDFFKMIPPNIGERSVVLIDVEGFEFNLVTKEFCDFFQKSIIFIEIHEWMVANGESALVNLINICSNKFEVNYIKSGCRNPNIYPELDCFEEEFRWLACSEGRTKPQIWLKLVPKK